MSLSPVCSKITSMNEHIAIGNTNVLVLFFFFIVCFFFFFLLTKIFIITTHKPLKIMFLSYVNYRNTKEGFMPRKNSYMHLEIQHTHIHTHTLSPCVIVYNSTWIYTCTLQHTHTDVTQQKIKRTRSK